MNLDRDKNLKSPPLCAGNYYFDFSWAGQLLLQPGPLPVRQHLRSRSCSHRQYQKGIILFAFQPSASQPFTSRSVP